MLSQLFLIYNLNLPIEISRSCILRKCSDSERWSDVNEVQASLLAAVEPRWKTSSKLNLLEPKVSWENKTDASFY